MSELAILLRRHFSVIPVFASDEAELRYLEGLKEQLGLHQEIGVMVSASRRLVFTSVSVPFTAHQLQTLALALQDQRVSGSLFFARMTVESIIEGFVMLTVAPGSPLDEPVNTFDKALEVAILNLIHSEMCPRGAAAIEPARIARDVMGLILDASSQADRPEVAAKADAKASVEASASVPHLEVATGEDDEDGEAEDEADEEEEADGEAEDGEEEEDPNALDHTSVKAWVMATFKPKKEKTTRQLDTLLNRVDAQDLSAKEKLEKLSKAVLQLEGKQLSSVAYRKAVDVYLSK